MSGDKGFAGRWTPEEEAYTDALIHEFRAGTLKGVEEGATLRNFLADAVGCHSKRISKKYEGTEYNGRQQFWRNIQSISPEETEERLKKLEELKKRFEESRAQSIERASRMKTKKRLRPTFIPPKPDRKPSRPKKKQKGNEAEATPIPALSKPVRGTAMGDESKVEDSKPAAKTAVENSIPKQEETPVAMQTNLASLAGTGSPRSLTATAALGTGFMQLGADTSVLNNLSGFGPRTAHPASFFGQGFLNPMLAMQTTNPLLLGLPQQPMGQLGLTSDMLRNISPDLLQSARFMAEEARKRHLILNALSMAKPPEKRAGKDP